MALSVSCPNCGKAYRVKEELSGKRFRCQQCHAVVSIPVAQPLPVAHNSYIAQPFPELAQNSFPPVPVAASAATADWALPMAPLQPIPVHLGNALPAGNVSSPMPAIKVHSPKKGPSPQPASAVFVLGLVGTTGVLTTIFVAVSLFSFPGAMVVLVVLLVPAMMVLGFWSQIGTLWVAFKEDFTCGIMCLFVPFYYFYFLISRWRYTARYAWMLLVHTAMTIVVAVVVVINAPRETATERSRRIEAQNMAILNDSLADAGLLPNGQDQMGSPQTTTPTRQLTPEEAAQWHKEWNEAEKQREQKWKEIEERFRKHEKEMESSFNRPPDSTNEPLAATIVDETERTYSTSEVEQISSPATSESKLEVKQRIYVSWGSSWYTCEVVNLADPQKPRIHYVGWSNGFDEDVSLERVRLLNP